MDRLSQLKKMTTVVADTGEINEIAKYHPTDATTNPSLILSALKNPAYNFLIEEAIEYVKSRSHPSSEAAATALMEKLFVNFGVEILKLVPGRVSTEVDARLSFDIEGSIATGRHLIALYEEQGISRERILIKLASTWEGIKAAKQLEKEGIHCNMTLLFSLPQAIASAEAGATLISPFVGRIFDWYKKNGKADFIPSEDPGVLSVREIYTYFKKFGYPTQIMGASFRNVEQITELAGCDLLTIAPDLLALLQNSQEPLERKLDPSKAKSSPIEKRVLDEKQFRYELNENAMATEKLAEGIRRFAEDGAKLRKELEARFAK